MLIEFQVENYLSYRDAKTLSMVASGQISEYTETHVISSEKIPLLKSAVLYGANASGKSNLLSAMAFMKWFVVNSSKEGQIDESIEVSPFKLDAATKNEASHFEATFTIDTIRYRYGFQADCKTVTAEWLFMAKKETENPLFLRENDEIKVLSGFPEGKDLESKTRDNSLFLSVVANFNGEISKQIVTWFRTLTIAHGLRETEYASVSTDMIQDAKKKEKLIKLIQKADFGIDDITATEEDERYTLDLLNFINEKNTSHLPKLFKTISLNTTHTQYSNRKPSGITTMSFDKEESAGTQKFFKLIGPVLESLYDGTVLVVDELEAKLHPLLVRMIVRLYHSNTTNPHGAQLIFATHNTNLLNRALFRRDQIWFAEKDQQQATDLYSLAEIKISHKDGTDKSVRKDARYETDYFKGKYGAIPYLGDFEQLLKTQGAIHG